MAMFKPELVCQPKSDFPRWSYGNWDAYVRFDGCIEIGVTEESDGTREQLHFCGFDALIQFLQEVRRRALEHFGGEDEVEFD